MPGKMTIAEAVKNSREISADLEERRRAAVDREAAEREALNRHCAPSTGSDVRGIPAVIESELTRHGWRYADSATGWTRDGTMHFYRWEDAAAKVMSECPCNPNDSSETGRHE